MDDLLEDRTQDFETMSVTSSGVQLPVKQLEAAMRCATARLSGATAAVEKAGAQEYETVEGVFSLSVSDGRERTLLDATGETAFGEALDDNYDAVKDILLDILDADEVELTFEDGSTNEETVAYYVAMYFDEETADAIYNVFDVDSFDTAVEKRIGNLSGFEGWGRRMRVREEGRPSRGTGRRSNLIARFPRWRRPTTTGDDITGPPAPEEEEEQEGDECMGETKAGKCRKITGCLWKKGACLMEAIEEVEEDSCMAETKAKNCKKMTSCVWKRGVCSQFDCAALKKQTCKKEDKCEYTDGMCIMVDVVVDVCAGLKKKPCKQDDACKYNPKTKTCVSEE